MKPETSEGSAHTDVLLRPGQDRRYEAAAAAASAEVKALAREQAEKVADAAAKKAAQQIPGGSRRGLPLGLHRSADPAAASPE